MDIEHFHTLHPDCGMLYLINKEYAAHSLHLSQKSRCIFLNTLINCNQDYMGLYTAFNWYLQIVPLILLNIAIINQLHVQFRNKLLCKFAEGSYITTDHQPSIINHLGGIPKPLLMKYMLCFKTDIQIFLQVNRLESNFPKA